MTNAQTLSALELPTLPEGYVWSITDYFGNPDGDPKDGVYRKGQRVVLAVHRPHRFGPFRFSIRVGRVKAFVLDPRSELLQQNMQQSAQEILESLRRRIAADAR